jgi:hypothetical protein
MILLDLAGYALGEQKQIPTPVIESEPKVTVLQVKIDGCVEKPGLYRLPLHATLGDLLEQAHPLPNADLSHLKEWRKLREGQTIQIPERHWITIQILGAVQQPGSLKILSGTRCCELADQLQISQEGDLKALRKKRRFLKEGDIIEIPFKKVKKKKGI